MSDGRLSQTATGKAWVAQFSEGKRQYATRLLDAMLLVNEEQVATSIRSLLSHIGQTAEGQGHRVGLYTEREFDEKYAFDIQSVPDATGRLRQRAVGLKGPVAIKTVRGAARIGSEGSISSIISSVIETNRAIFSNHPGPDRIRSAKAPIRLLVIVTDFIGSGARICSMLDKFWNVPTVKSWVSGKRVSFAVVAAVGTQSGIDQVKRHRLSPAVHVDRIAPTIFTFSKKMKARWSDIIKSEGPDEKGDDPFGYNGSGALVAFSYRIPNNTPLFLRVSRGRAKNRWRALYEGHAPEDLRAAFGLKTSARLIESASENVGVELDPDLPPRDAHLVLALTAVRGKWLPEASYAVAEEIGLSVSDVTRIRRRATTAGLLDARGRLTNAGQKLVRAGTSVERTRPAIPTSPKPYYPVSLRVPGG